MAFLPRQRRLTAPPMPIAPAMVPGGAPLAPQSRQQNQKLLLSTAPQLSAPNAGTGTAESSWSPELFHKEQAASITHSEVFDMLDRDSDGYLTLKDLVPVFGANPEQAVVARLQRCRDPTKGFTLKEFSDFFHSDKRVDVYYQEVADGARSPPPAVEAEKSSDSEGPKPQRQQARRRSLSVHSAGDTDYQPSLYRPQECPDRVLAPTASAPVPRFTNLRHPGAAAGIPDPQLLQQWEMFHSPHSPRRWQMDQADLGTKSVPLSSQYRGRKSVYYGINGVPVDVERKRMPIGSGPLPRGSTEFQNQRQRRQTAPAPAAPPVALAPGRVWQHQPVGADSDDTTPTSTTASGGQTPAAVPKVKDMLEGLTMAAERVNDAKQNPRSWGSEKQAQVGTFLAEFQSAVAAKRTEMVSEAAGAGVPTPTLSDGVVSAHLALQLLLPLLQANKRASAQEADESGIGFDTEAEEIEDGAEGPAKRPRRKRGGRRVREAQERAMRRAEVDRLEVVQIEQKDASGSELAEKEDQDEDEDEEVEERRQPEDGVPGVVRQNIAMLKVEYWEYPLTKKDVLQIMMDRETRTKMYEAQREGDEEFLHLCAKTSKFPQDRAIAKNMLQNLQNELDELEEEDEDCEDDQFSAIAETAEIIEA